MSNELDRTRAQSLFEEQNPDLFNKLPVFFAKNQADHLKWHGRWNKVVGKIPWQKNMGTLMRGVRKEPSPILRSQAFPALRNAASLKDVIQQRETTEDASVYKHDFESRLIHWLPSEEDWMTNHVSFGMEDINEKIQIYHDMFVRTFIFHASPKVWLCGATSSDDGTGELKDAPHFTSPTMAETKSAAYRTDAIAQTLSPLTLQQLRKIGGKMRTDVGVTPFSGKVLADGTDGKALAMKYCLIAGQEVWDSFADDQHLLDVKTDSLDIVTGPFQGSLFGRFTALLEANEIRIAADGSIPAPESVVESGYNTGESVPNAAYVNAPIGVAFVCGGQGYRSLQVGPPPGSWTNTTLKKFANLSWNGRTEITQNVLVPVAGDIQNAPGAATFDTNKRGDYIQLIASLVMGVLPSRRRNIIPIFYIRRAAGAANNI